MQFVGDRREIYIPGQPEALPNLLEVCCVFLCELRLVVWEFVDRIDRIGWADRDAVAAIDALIRIDKQLGRRVRAFLIAHRMDRSGGTLRRTQKILLTRIGNNVRHGLARFRVMGCLISAGDWLHARSHMQGNPLPEYRRIAPRSVIPVTLL